jgi:alpha-tubulin suppressor-like RCC1 family protein
VQAISAGGSHTCAIVNGGVRCWGANTYGQLGAGNTGVDSVTPVQVQGLTSGVTAVAAGESHTCAVANGAALCWGSGALGALGNNSTTNSPVPVQVQGLASGVTAIAAANSYTCAAVNGAAYCWGDGSHGRLARDPTTSTVPLAIHAIVDTGVTAITAGREHGCALVSSDVAASSVVCWGDDLRGNYLNVNPFLRASTAIAGDSASHNCVIMSVGGARCWGKNTFGELGSNSSGDLAQVEGLTSGVTAIAAGLNASCAIVNGGARCWGSAATLGNGVQDNSGYNAKPIQVKGLTSGVTAIDLGDQHACAIMNGGVRCWGTNNNGQVGTSVGLHEQDPHIIAEPVAVSLP